MAGDRFPSGLTTTRRHGPPGGLSAPAGWPSSARGELTVSDRPPAVAAILAICELAREQSRGWFDPWRYPAASISHRPGQRDGQRGRPPGSSRMRGSAPRWSTPPATSPQSGARPAIAGGTLASGHPRPATACYASSMPPAQSRPPARPQWGLRGHDPGHMTPAAVNSSREKHRVETGQGSGGG